MGNVTERMTVHVVGVGGQGVHTTARLLGDAAMRAGHDVVVTQLHGMAQRGGNVESTVSIGPDPVPFLGRGGADVVLGFEPLEVARALPWMSERTVVVASRSPIVPYALTRCGREYPDVDGVLDAVRRSVGSLVSIDAVALAREAGAPRAVGAVLLGALAVLGLPVLHEALLRAALDAAPHDRQSALRAFELGERAASVALAHDAHASERPSTDPESVTRDGGACANR